MMAKLKYDVTVAGDVGELVELPRGTSHNQIKKSMLDQLSPDHFDGDLEDWRSEERQQADRDFVAAKEAEMKERRAAKDERLKAERVAQARERIEADRQLISELEGK